MIATDPTKGAESTLTSRRLFELSALALLIALPLQIAGSAIHPAGEEVKHVLQATYGPAHLILFVSWVFALLGLPGLYAWQASRAGTLGLISFVLLIVTAAYHLYLLLYEAFATTELASNAATQGLIADGPMAHGVKTLAQYATPLILAFPLFGIATLRAGVLPRWCGWLQIASVPILMLSAVLLSVIASGAAEVVSIRLLYILEFLGWAWGAYAIRAATAPTRLAAPRLSTPRPAS